MQTLPSHDRFARAAGQTFRLHSGTDGAVEAELRRVDMRVAMNERHECFALLFALPPGTALPQALYRVDGPEGLECALMLTPVRPEPDGRSCLEAVFHRLKAPAAA